MLLRTATASLLAGLTALSQAGSCQKEQPGNTPGSSSGSEGSAQPQQLITLDGIDTSALTLREKREWSGYVSRYPAPCKDAGSVAACVQSKNSCKGCLPAAKFLYGLVRDGHNEELVDMLYKARFDDSTVKKVPLDESPVKGAEKPAVTMVEFADFECPSCGGMAPLVAKALQERKSAVQLVFKFLPLPSHPNAEPAAKASIAAWRQGKFWEMHDKLFANQRQLSKQDLERYAKEIGLDLAKFRVDFESTTTRDRIERDKKLSDDLDVRGTPSFYINGRLFDPQQDLGQWLDTELLLVGLDPAKVKQDSAAQAAGDAPQKTEAAAPAKAGETKPKAQ